MSDWQDISTAPRDGTKVDLLYPYPRGRTIDCYWSACLGDEGWVWREATWGDEGELLPEAEWSVSSYPNMQPTHWILPPEPPVIGTLENGYAGVEGRPE